MGSTLRIFLVEVHLAVDPLALARPLSSASSAEFNSSSLKPTLRRVLVKDPRCDASLATRT